MVTATGDQASMGSKPALVETKLFHIRTASRTRRERLKSALYLRLKNIQGTTIGKIWKNFFFQKKIF